MEKQVLQATETVLKGTVKIVGKAVEVVKHGKALFAYWRSQ